MLVSVTAQDYRTALNPWRLISRDHTMSFSQHKKGGPEAADPRQLESRR